MRVIGIDPGTGKLGFGVIDIKNSKFQLIEAGIITTPAHTPLDDRLVDIFDNLMEIIDRTKPNFMSIEKFYFAQNVNNRY